MNIILLRREELKADCFSFFKTDERFRHIEKILKLTVGSIFQAGVINGEKGTAEIIAFSKEQLTAHFKATECSAPLPAIRLILGFPRPIQLRRILRDVAGLGIETLYLTGTELGEKSYLQADIAAAAEIERLLINGCSQAGETNIPHVHCVHSLRQFFDPYEADIRPEDVRAVLDVPFSLSDAASVSCLTGREVPYLSTYFPRSRASVAHSREEGFTAAPPIRPLTTLQWKSDRFLWLAVGNERGWSDGERSCFAKKRFTSYNMGRRILRTETAVTSALAVCLALSGIWDDKTLF